MFCTTECSIFYLLAPNGGEWPHSPCSRLYLDYPLYGNVLDLRTAVNVMYKKLSYLSHIALSNHTVPHSISNSAMCLYGAPFRHRLSVVSEQNLKLWRVLNFVTRCFHYILIFWYFPSCIFLK